MYSISMLSINQTNDYLGIIHENKNIKIALKEKQLLKSVFERFKTAATDAVLICISIDILNVFDNYNVLIDVISYYKIL